MIPGKQLRGVRRAAYKPLMSIMLNPASAMAMANVFSAFRGGDFDCLMHVSDSRPERLRRVMDAYEGVGGQRCYDPKVVDAERGVVNVPGFGDQDKRRRFESWLAAGDYGWKPLPRPLRTHVAYRNASPSDFLEDTIKVFTALEWLGWTLRRDDYRVGSGLYKPGTPVTELVATIANERVKAKVAWQASWEGGRVLPNWVHVGGTPGCPESVTSRFSTLTLSAELLLEEDRHHLWGHQTLTLGIMMLLAPMVIDRSPLSLSVAGLSADAHDWPGCLLEFSLQQP